MSVFFHQSRNISFVVMPATIGLSLVKKMRSIFIIACLLILLLMAQAFNSK